MNPEEDSKTRKFAQSYGEAGPYIGMGVQFAAFILLFLCGGWWMDQKWSLAPLFTILGTLVGAVLGFYRLYKTLMAEGQKRKEEEAD